MHKSERSEDRTEKLISGLSGFLVSKLNTLGYQRYGIDRDDLLQEIHIRIWKASRNNNNDIRYFNAYLKKIITSVFINEINRINKENKTLEIAGPSLNPNGNTNGRTAAEDRFLKDVLVASIDDLKEPKRRVIRLRLEGFSFEEIACLNSWTYRKTCLIFYRGLKDLKNKLEQKGIHCEN